VQIPAYLMPFNDIIWGKDCCKHLFNTKVSTPALLTISVSCQFENLSSSSLAARLLGNLRVKPSRKRRLRLDLCSKWADNHAHHCQLSKQARQIPGACKRRCRFNGLARLM